MRKGLLALCVGTMLSAGSITAEAMPAGALDAAAGAPGIVLVSGGCGIGFHRGLYGVCRPNGFFRPYGYGYGYVHPYYRGFDPGWHRGWHRW